MNTNPRYYLVHGLSLAAQKDWHRAIEFLSTAIDFDLRDDDKFDAIVCRANCYMQIRDWKHSSEDSQLLISQWPLVQAGYLIHANILSATDEVRDAIKAHLHAIGQGQNPSETGAGKDVFGNDPVKETLHAYKVAIDKNPTEPQAWVDRGRFYARLGKDPDALVDAKCALAIAPDHPGANLLYAQAIENHGQFEDAVRALWHYIENAHEDHIDDVIEAALYIRTLLAAESEAKREPSD